MTLPIQYMYFHFPIWHSFIITLEFVLYHRSVM